MTTRSASINIGDRVSLLSDPRGNDPYEVVGIAMKHATSLVEQVRRALTVGTRVQHVTDPTADGVITLVQPGAEWYYVRWADDGPGSPRGPYSLAELRKT